MEIFEATLVLLAAALALSAVAGRLAVPYPSFLVIGGLALGFLPGLPAIKLDPALAFALFLPPILFEAAYYTSWRDFRANIVAIGSLAIGLVALTTTVVAVVAEHLIPELPLGSAIVLGAIVAPPDAAAATAVLRRMHLPPRIIAIVEGESLVNDAVALVIYNFAVAAVMTGNFSGAEAAQALSISVVGSLALGWVLGWGWTRLSAYMTDPLISVASSFLMAFGTYLVAEHLNGSGVLAVVTAGLVFAWRAPSVLTADVRLSAAAVWRLAIFILNALAFVLIGLQLPGILQNLSSFSFLTLARDALIVAATVIGVRLAWAMLRWQRVGWITRWVQHAPYPDWKESLVIGWSGMRGLVSLAAALALPETTVDGSPFPARELVLFLAFSVILATLVVQGLTLGTLVRLLKLDTDSTTDREEALARIEAANAAIAAIDRLAETPGLPADVFDRLRLLYTTRIQSLAEAESEGGSSSNGDFMDAVRLTALDAERTALLRLRNDKVIGDAALHRIQRDLDLVETSVKRRKPNYAQASWVPLTHAVNDAPAPAPV